MSGLEASSLSAWYEAPGGTIPIARDINLYAAPGTITGIVGPNGCGKTTILRALAGLHEGRRGNVLIDGEAIRRDQISYLSQNYRQTFFPWASLRTHLGLNLPGKFWNGRSRNERIEAACALMEVDVDLNLRPHQASGGMLQQVNLLLLASRCTPVFLADEPFSALDISVAERLRRNFRDLVVSSKAIALIVLHDPVDILELCDQVLLIPDKPFSTQATALYNRAEIVERHVSAQLPRSHGAAPFAAAIKRILDA